MRYAENFLLIFLIFRLNILKLKINDDIKLRDESKRKSSINQNELNNSVPVSQSYKYTLAKIVTYLLNKI